MTETAPRTRFGTEGYKNLRFEFSLTEEDPWSDALSWWFAVAELLYHYYGATLPDSWQFRDSPAHADGYDPDESYEDSELFDMADRNAITEADVRAFGDVLTRYLGLLKAAGRDY